MINRLVVISLKNNEDFYAFTPLPALVPFMYSCKTMKNLLIVILILFLPVRNYSQLLAGAIEKNIPLCCRLTEPDFEFSGLTKWKNFLLFIPQHNTINDVHNIVAIDTLSIDSVLQNQSPVVSSYKIIVFDSSLNAVIKAIEQLLANIINTGVLKQQ